MLVRRCPAALSLVLSAWIAAAQTSPPPAGGAAADTASKKLPLPETAKDPVATDAVTQSDEGAAESRETADTVAVGVDSADGRPVEVMDTAAFDSSALTHVMADSAKTAQAAPAPSDTSLRFYDSPFIAFGTGWTLGSMPLFDEWQVGLPDSIGEMPGYEMYADSIQASLSEREPPDAYNTAFPFSVSFAPLVRPDGYLTVGGSFRWMSKDYLALWRTDTSGTLWQAERELSLLATSIDLTYFYRIPAQYFAIANIDRAHVVIGLSASPYVRIQDVRRDISDVAGFNTERRKNYRGYAASWTAGISTLRPLSERAGIEIGLVYLGHWFGRFMKHDHHVTWQAISEDADDPGEVLSFMAHRFKIYFNILVGRKQKAAAQKEPQAKADASAQPPTGQGEAAQGQEAVEQPPKAPDEPAGETAKEAAPAPLEIPGDRPAEDPGKEEETPTE